MSKIKLCFELKTEEESLKKELIASIESGIISYKEDNDTFVYLDINKDELIRENKEVLMKFKFNQDMKTKSNILIKDLNQNLDIEIETINLEKNTNSYYVEYLIENNKFKYKVEFMEV